jgi:hypothetical protein
MGMNFRQAARLVKGRSRLLAPLLAGMVLGFGGIGVASAQQAEAPQAASESSPSSRTSLDYYKGHSLGGHNDYLFRYEEDYSYLSDPKRSTDVFDPLKYLPLSQDGTSWISLNAGLRLMYDHNLTNVAGAPFGSLNDLYERATVGADLHLGEHFRAYFDAIDGQYHGTGPMPGVTTTDLGVYNAFVEFMGTAGEAKYGVRIGRQQVWIGNALMFGINELTNIPQTQNGARAYADWGSGRIDVFDFMPTTYGLTALSGNINTGVHMSGIYTSFDLPAFSLFGAPAQTTLDPFLFRFTSAAGTYYDASLALPSMGRPEYLTGSDERNTLGLRYSGKIGGVDFDYTGAVQTGNFAGHPVEAWMFATDTGYTFNTLPLTPRFGMQVDGASGGDSSQRGGSLHTYQPMYFDAPYYSEALAVSPTNLIDVSPHFTIKPAPRLSIDAYWAFYWRQTLGDAIYSGLYGGALSINPYAGTEKVGGKYIGQQPTLAFRWRATKHLFVDLTLAYFKPGEALRSVGGKSTPWVLFFTSLSF